MMMMIVMILDPPPMTSALKGHGVKVHKYDVVLREGA